jgi:protein SCO1/2
MTTPPPAARPPTPYRNILIGMGVIIVLLLAARAIYPGPPAAASDLRRINIIPPFGLTERSGKTITNTDLLGKIWVAAFVYTTCPGPCPLVTASMAKLQDAVAHDPNVQLVTFTVDPTTDTPAVLSSYADQYHADKNRWWFLTGSEKQMYDLIRKGFFLPVENNTGQPLEAGQYKVTHSTQLALVDADGVLRGFYDGVHPEGRAELLKAIAILEKEKS